KKPIVHCRAHTQDKTIYAKYQGIQSCTAANALADVPDCLKGAPITLITAGLLAMAFMGFAGMIR
ncbi:MAG TPA: hypothetical protein VMW23_03865, partial [Sedimentisphaerales bacterium]|nr:hypothetical protein [Sedimentisphaerales bacterium]